MSGVYLKALHSGSWNIVPKVKSAELLGLVSDSRYNRDSCGSSTFGNRTLWTCRDTQSYHLNGTIRQVPILASSASWSDLNDLGGPALLRPSPSDNPLYTTILEQYGDKNMSQSYFPILEGLCDEPAGACNDVNLTRYAIWPNLPPLVVPPSKDSDSAVTGYTWIKQLHLNPDLSLVSPFPATILYRVEYGSSSSSSSFSSSSLSNPNRLPQVTVVDPGFWSENEIPYGTYGTVIHNDTAYLYAHLNGTTAWTTALAKVPASSIEDKSAYKYWVNGAWTSARPSFGQKGINVPNSNAGSQGTYYYSSTWNRFVWIGGTRYLGAKFYITTAPSPTGPWTKPMQFWRGPSGNYTLDAYSVQAHPGFSNGDENEMYVTYTKNDVYEDGNSGYSTPLVKIVWE